MDGNFDDVAINTFKSSLPVEYGLRKSLTDKPATSVRQLMDWINKYKRVEEDQMQGKGKEKVIPQERRDFRLDRYTNSHPKRDFAGQSETTNAQNIGAVFREPVHKVLEKIKSKPYFGWLNKMAGESTKLDRYTNSPPRRDFAGQSETTNAQNVGAVFREPVHQVLEKIKSEPYFRWLNKMSGKSTKRNQNLYFQYH